MNAAFDGGIAKKDPRVKTREPIAPPMGRSRAARRFAAAAAEGRFALQRCGECGAWQYPPRDACRNCLSADLAWVDAPRYGAVLAETTIRATADPHFRDRLPWRIGSVRLDVGQTIIAHLHAAVGVGERVRVETKLDALAQATIVAGPATKDFFMGEDPELRTLVADPSGRRVLVTDGFNPVGAAATQALLAAGAATVFQGAGRLQDWSVGASAEPRLRIVPLDVTDTSSVERLAAEIGNKVDILINTATTIRPGGLFDRKGCVTAQEEMATNYFGALRLAQAFGPVMRARAADGADAAAAWVNILSINALVSGPPFVCFNASQAAALSLSQGLRAAFHGSGVRVLNILAGPFDDEWRQSIAPPKVSPATIVKAVIAGLMEGVEDVAVGDVARELYAEWKLDAKAAEIALRG